MTLGEKSLVREWGCVDVYVCGGSVDVGAAVKEYDENSDNYN